MAKVTHLKLQKTRAGLLITGFCTPRGGTRFRATPVAFVPRADLEKPVRQESLTKALDGLLKTG